MRWREPICFLARRLGNDVEGVNPVSQHVMPRRYLMSEQRNSESLLGAYWMLGLTDERWLPSGKVLADMGAALKVEKPGGNIAIGPIYKVTRDPLLPLVIPHQSQQARHHLQPGYSTWRKALREMVKTPASSPLIQVGASSVSAQRGLRNIRAASSPGFPGGRSAFQSGACPGRKTPGSLPPEWLHRADRSRRIAP